MLEKEQGTVDTKFEGEIGKDYSIKQNGRLHWKSEILAKPVFYSKDIIY